MRAFAGGVVLALVTPLLLPSAAEAGAWTKAWGEYYSKLGADFYAPAAYVDPETREESEDRFFGQSYSLYFEIGVLPVWPLQVSVQVPVQVGTVFFRDPSAIGDTEARATTTRPGDLRIGLQGQILRKTLQLSVGLDVKIPMYSNDTVGSDWGDYKEVFPLPGDGQIDLTGMVQLGGAIPDTPIWMDGGVGYRHRSETFVAWETDLEFVDSLVWRYVFGAGDDHFIGMFLLDGNKNFLLDAVTREGLAIGGGALITLWRGLSLELRAQGEVWTNNASQGASFGVGLSYRRPNPWSRAQPAD